MEANPTLDQLLVLVTIVDAGGFSAAARRLNRAQSNISYAISNLEDQLGLSLFDRNGSRRPMLTEAGIAIVEEARRMAAGLDHLRGRAVALHQGLEGELSLAVSMMVSASTLADVLRDFQVKYPTVSVKLHWGSGFMVNDMVMKATAQLGIGGAVMKMEDSFVFDRLGRSLMVPVVAPSHPLAKLHRRLSIDDVRNEVQIVVSDETRQTDGRDFNVFSRRTWRVGDMATKHVMLCAGLGWGGIHSAIVEEDLRFGRLVSLSMDGFESSYLPILALWKAANPPGPAARWMIERFRSHLASEGTDQAR